MIGLALCKNLQSQSIPLECGPDCWNHLGSPWIAPRAGFMGRALHPGYHTRATPVLIPACFDRGQVLCLQPSRTPHLRRPLWEETDSHLSLLSLTIFLSDPQRLLSSLSPPGPLNMLLTPKSFWCEGLPQGRWNGDRKWADSCVLQVQPVTSLVAQGLRF